MLHISYIIKKGEFFLTLLLSALVITGCETDYNEGGYLPPHTPVQSDVISGHTIYVYTKNALMKYNDIFFFLKQFQTVLQQNPVANEEGLFFIPNGTVYSHEDDDERIYYQIVINTGDGRPRYSIDVYINDENMQNWTVKGRSEYGGCKIDHSMNISMNGKRWIISNCSSDVVGKTNMGLMNYNMAAFTCKSTSMSLRWMDVDSERTVYEMKAKGILESVVGPTLAIDYATERSLIVADFVNYEQERLNRSKDEDNETLEIFHFTQWIAGSFVLGIYDSIDDTHEDLDVKIMDGRSTRIMFRGIEQDHYW